MRLNREAYILPIAYQSGKNLDYKKVALEDVFKSSDKSAVYPLSTYYYSTSVTFGSKNYKAYCYPEVTAYVDGDWYYGAVIIIYDSSWSRGWHPAGYQYVLTTQAYPAIFAKNVVSGYYVYFTNFTSNIDNQTYLSGASFGTSYSSNLAARFRASDHDEADEYKDDGKSLIKDTKVTSSWNSSTSKYTIKFSYGYDYRVKSGFLNLGRSWKNTTNTITLGEFVTKSGATKTANTTRFSSSTDYSSVVNSLGSTTWCLSGGKPMLKWLNWSENTTCPPNYN